MDPIRLLLADDHAMVRKGIRDFLEEDPGIQVVAEAENGEQAVTLAVSVRPQIAILDIQMPGQNGLEAARKIKQLVPETQILMLTAYEDEPYVFAALQAGANGYLLKTASSDELIQAVRAIAAGETALSPTVAKKLVQRAAGVSPHEPVAESISDRELEVLQLAARGLSNKQIAGELAISDRTVQGHLASVYDKLHVSTRTEAVLYAVRQKWITLE